MKIKITNVKKKLMINFFLNKYRNLLKKNNTFKSLKIIELQIKRALNLILFFHIKNKQILFVGFPEFLNKKIQNRIKKSKHYFLPSNLWFPGSFSNETQIKYFKNQNISLIVVFNKNNSDNLLLLNEIKTTNVPVIVFGPVLYSHRLFLGSYLVNKTITHKFLNNFLFYLIYSILKIK